MSERHRSVAIGVLAVVLASGRLAAAEDPSARTIDVFVAGAADALPRLERAIGVAGRALRWRPIGVLDVGEVVRPPSDTGSHDARAWIDCSRPNRVRIYFADWNTERFLLRDVPLPDGWTEIGLEAIGQVLESSLSALDTDAKTGMSRSEMTSAITEKPPPPPPPRPAGWRGSLGAFYAVQAFAPEQTVEQGVGLAGSIEQRDRTWRLGGWLSAQYRLPETIAANLIGVHLDTVSFRGGARVARTVAPRIELALEAGLGADVVHIAPRQGSTEQATLSEGRFSVSPTSELAVVCAVRLAPSLALWGALLADADFVERHYEVMVDGATVTVITPYWFRPGVAAGLSWP